MTMPLFDHDIAAPFSGVSPETRATSKAAAITVASTTITDRWRVLAAIKRAGERGLTDAELQRDLFMSGNTERPRRIELWKAGKIQPQGKRDKHTVWVAV